MAMNRICTSNVSCGSGEIVTYKSYITFTMWRHWWGVSLFALHAMFHVMVSVFLYFVSCTMKYHNAFWNTVCNMIQFWPLCGSIVVTFKMNCYPTHIFFCEK